MFVSSTARRPLPGCGEKPVQAIIANPHAVKSVARTAEPPTQSGDCDELEEQCDGNTEESSQLSRLRITIGPGFSF